MMAILRVKTTAALDAADRFQALVDHFVSNLGNIGVIAGIDVAGQGRKYFTAGHTTLDKAKPVDCADLFQIGSQSKTAIAMTMVLLERAGHLRLDDPVSRYLDLSIDAGITLRHLLMNQSGLGESTFATPAARFDPRVEFRPRDLVALAVPQGQLFAPGHHFDYCNTGWVIAAMTIEAVCTAPYGTVIQELLLAPLSLTNTFFGGSPPVERMMRGYIESDATGGPIDSAECLSWAYGAGDGVSSVDDMLTLFSSLRDPGAKIALSELIERTGKPSKTPYFLMSIGTEYGLGLEKRMWAGRSVWGHPGSTMSYLSGTWIDPDLGVTVTTCVTRHIALPAPPGSEHRYPREQLFAMALNTAYALNGDRDD